MRASDRNREKEGKRYREKVRKIERYRVGLAGKDPTKSLRLLLVVVFTVQAALVIRGLLFCDFAYSRSKMERF